MRSAAHDTASQHWNNRIRVTSMIRGKAGQDWRNPLGSPKAPIQRSITGATRQFHVNKRGPLGSAALRAMLKYFAFHTLLGTCPNQLPPSAHTTPPAPHCEEAPLSATSAAPTAGGRQAGRVPSERQIQRHVTVFPIRLRAISVGAQGYTGIGRSSEQLMGSKFSRRFVPE